MNEKINKPITMVVKETRMKLANVCNESGLPPVILDLIIHGLYSEIHTISEEKALEDEISYMNAVKNSKTENEDIESDESDAC